MTGPGTSREPRAAGAARPGGSAASEDVPGAVVPGAVAPGAVAGGPGPRREVAGVSREVAGARPTDGSVKPHERDLATKVREKSVLGAYRAATWTLGVVPPRLSWTVGGALAEGAYRAWPSKRRNTRSSLAHVLGTTLDDPQVDQLARRMHRNYARYVVDLMRLPNLPPEYLAAHVDMAAADDVDRVSALGRGVIMVGMHLGHAEAFAAAVAHRGWVVSAVADDSAHHELYAHLKAQRERWGIRLVSWRSLREMYAALRRMEMVGMLVDWGYKPDGIPVRFFGAWTTFPAGPAVLAARTGAVLLPVSVPMMEDGRYAGRTHPSIEVASSTPADLARATQAIAHAVEADIRRTPDQWWVFKPMWPETAEERERLLERLPEYGLKADDGPGGA